MGLRGDRVLTGIQSFIREHRILVSTGVGVILFLLARPTPVSIWAGIPIVLAGEAIRVWASGCINKAATLAREGPYAYVRHPLYLGSFLIGLGFAVMASHVAVFVGFLAAFYAIYRPAIVNEDRWMADRFGEQWHSYRAKVPPFFPRLSRPTGHAGTFEWGKVLKHREHQTWVGIALGVLALVLRMKAVG